MQPVYPAASYSPPTLERRALLTRFARALAGAGILATAGPARILAQVSLDPFWVQTHRSAELWSGPDAAAISFGVVPQWTYLEVVAPQAGPRLRVRGRDGAAGYIEAAAVGPVGPPPEDATTAEVWVANHLPTPLWSGPDGDGLPLGELDQWNPFELLAGAGPRLRARDPRTGGEVFLDPEAVGRGGRPERPLPVPARWWGSIGAAEANIRATPGSAGAPLDSVERQTPVVVRAWVAGQEVLPDQPTWAELADGVFVYSPLLRAAAVEQPPPPPDAPTRGRWIDANLTHQVAVAYQGTEPVSLARFSSGRPGWETSTGTFPITRRVANEVMDSSTLLGRDAARASYRLEGIRWVQYFTADGQAIHHNYWRDPALFGIPSSHGCLGMLEPDARFFWDFAAVGTRLVVHY